MTVRRERTVAAPLEAVWAVVGDPYHLPRWWPMTERVEAVEAGAWTSVLRGGRGRAVRADFVVEAHEPPRRRAWRQQLENSPFERIVLEARTAVELREAASPSETVVALTIVQRQRGTARLGGFMVRRALRRQLDTALSGLAGALE
ncbi:MAG: hypothetical protein QOE28_1835 [Solirubrobacteraceae bacterium]|nr:hypothetical protein [Solirubrobacteraceae bacterium]